MIARVSIISLLLASSFAVAMESDYESIHLGLVSEEERETAIHNQCISSLESWIAVAKENESIEGYRVLPQAMAACQQKYEIKSDLSVQPEIVAIWMRAQDSDDYKKMAARYHALLRGDKVEKSGKEELTALHNFMLKKMNQEYADNEQAQEKSQQEYTTNRPWSIGCGVSTIASFALMVTSVVLFVIPKNCNH